MSLIYQLTKKEITFLTKLGLNSLVGYILLWTAKEALTKILKLDS
jgi:hypothetical protein